MSLASSTPDLLGYPTIVKRHVARRSIRLSYRNCHYLQGFGHRNCSQSIPSNSHEQSAHSKASLLSYGAVSRTALSSSLISFPQREQLHPLQSFFLLAAYQMSSTGPPYFRPGRLLCPDPAFTFDPIFQLHFLAGHIRLDPWSSCRVHPPARSFVAGHDQLAATPQILYRPADRIV